jgi:large subunit ribosomal protein L35
MRIAIATKKISDKETELMPKIKTRKTAAKRFKITGTGKLIHQHAYRNHLNIHKGPSEKRRLGTESQLYKGKRKAIRRMLPNGVAN